MPVCKDFVVRCNVGGLSLQRFHFFNGIFLGRWYPEGFHAKSMVSKRFARCCTPVARIHVKITSRGNYFFHRLQVQGSLQG